MLRAPIEALSLLLGPAASSHRVALPPRLQPAKQRVRSACSQPNTDDGSSAVVLHEMRASLESRVEDITDGGCVPLPRHRERHQRQRAVVAILPAKRQQEHAWQAVEHVRLPARKLVRRDYAPIQVLFGGPPRAVVRAQPVVAAQPLVLAGCMALPLAAGPSTALATVQPAPAARWPRPDAPVLTADGLRAAAAAAAAALPRLTRPAIALRSTMGMQTDNRDIQRREVVHEAMQLVVLLPPYSLARVCARAL